MALSSFGKTIRTNIYDLIKVITFHDSTVEDIAQPYRAADFGSTPLTAVRIFRVRGSSDYVESRLNKRISQFVVRIYVLMAGRPSDAEDDLDYLYYSILQKIENNLHAITANDVEGNVQQAKSWLQDDRIQSLGKQFNDNYWYEDIQLNVESLVPAST